MVRHAQHCLDHDRDCRPLAAVHRFARSRVDLVAPADAEEARMLANDEA